MKAEVAMATATSKIYKRRWRSYKYRYNKSADQSIIMIKVTDKMKRKKIDDEILEVVVVVLAGKEEQQQRAN